MINERKTNRGFNVLEFNDSHNIICTIQESSSALAPAIWIGVDKPEPKIMASNIMSDGTGWVDYPIHEDVLINTRMHLNQNQIKEILPVLYEFVYTGELNKNARISNAIFTNKQIDFIETSIENIIIQTESDIDKYGLNNEATVGALDVLQLSQGIIEIINKNKGE